MYALVQVYWEMCLFRRGPQHLPASQFLTGAALLSYCLLGVLISLFEQPLVEALGSALTHTLLLAGFVWALLQWRGHGPRYVQTLAALAGTGAVFSALAIVPMVLLTIAQHRQGDPALPVLMILGLIMWDLAVVAHLLRHALSTSFGVGLLWSLGLFFFSISVMSLLFPQSA
jgi:hypothetical protein